MRALTDYLAYETKVAHRTSGPLFASRQNGRTTALTDAAWRRTLKETWKAAGLSDDTRISTRSMRVTGATLAHLGGANIADICSLTDHRSPEMAGVYVRRRNPRGHHITLDESAGAD